MKGLQSSILGIVVFVALLGLVACEGGSSPNGDAPDGGAAKVESTGKAAEEGSSSAASSTPTPPTPPEKPAVTETPKTPEKSAVDPAIAAIDAHIASLNIDKSNASWKMRLSQPPTLSFTAGKKYFWNIATNKGDIKVQLMPDVAPIHVSSTIFLTQTGFYDGLIFHRVIPGFMAQGGCPQGSGRGGPGYKYAGEFDPNVKHDRPGLLSMANAGPGTDGSQFFLTFVPTAWLDGKHTVFGEIVEGLDTTMKELEKLGSRGGRTSEKLLMEKCTISVE